MKDVPNEHHITMDFYNVAYRIICDVPDGIWRNESLNREVGRVKHAEVQANSVVLKVQGVHCIRGVLTRHHFTASA